jgi:formylglycine-generating enzyme required for sulfatase activity
MKKHLTATPPSFHSFGVSVSPAIEAVVRHSLEKDVSARVDSVSSFLQDLHAAMNSAPVFVPSSRDTGGLDPNKTVTDTQPPIPAISTQPPIAIDTNFSASASSPPATVKPPNVEQQQPKIEHSIQEAKEIEKPVERSGVNVPPVHQVDLEETRVRAGVADSMASGLQSSRQVGQPMIISLPAKRKFNPALLVVAAAVILLTGAGIAAYLIFRPKPPIDDPLVVKADLIPIEGGTFEMGRNTGPPQETPAHSVRIASFAMDKTEVTNSEYAQFVRESKHEPPSYWGGTNPPAGQDLLPVVDVSFDDVNTFAAWRSKRDKVTYRLPTEEEWEYAARNGDKGDTYPWGSEWKDRIAVVKESSAAPVGSRPDGQNKWGVVDLVGNVWELTSSRVSIYPGNAATVPNNMKDWVTMRGGCYASDPSKRDSSISSYMRDFIPPNTKSTLLGFRLVRTDN